MKTAISIPDPVFRAAEEAARRLSLSRSELYTTAVRQFLERHQSADVTERLERVYAENPSRVDPVVLEMQRLSLPEDDSW